MEVRHAELYCIVLCCIVDMVEGDRSKLNFIIVEMKVERNMFSDILKGKLGSIRYFGIRWLSGLHAGAVSRWTRVQVLFATTIAIFQSPPSGSL